MKIERDIEIPRAANQKQAAAGGSGLASLGASLCFFVLVLLAPGSVPALAAQTPGEADAALKAVGFAQRLDEQVPLNLRFRDSTGRRVRLGGYFGSKPVILSLVYFKCPMLCTETLNGLTRAIRDLKYDAGRQYNLLTVSFDPREGPALAAAKKSVYVARYGRRGAGQGWFFLTGREPQIRALADAVGFHYAYDRKLDQYAHATGIMVLTPQGRISRYLYGLEYSPRELRLALLDASSGRIGSPVDKFLLYCYCYNPLTGKYGLAIQRLMQVAGVLTVLFVGGMIGWFVYLERKHVAAS